MATLDDAISALLGTSAAAASLIQSVTERKQVLDAAVASAVAAATQTGADRTQTGADRTQTASDRAAVSTARDLVTASRDAVTQFAGISKTYATYAAANADVANIAANAFAMVIADEGRGSRTTVYQKTGSVLTFTNQVSNGAWATIVAYPGEFYIRAAANAQIAAGGGTVLLPPGKHTLTSPLPAAPYLRYRGVRPQITFNGIPDNPWSFTANNTGTVFVGDGTFACFAGNNTPGAEYSSAPTQADAQAFARGGLTGFSIEGVGIDTFSRGLDLGAHNIAGVLYGELSYIWVRNCTDWGVHLVNTMHTPVHHIWVVVDKGATGGHGFRLAYDVPATVLIAGNHALGDIYVYQGNLTKYGIRIHAVGSSTGNQVTTIGRLQCNRFGGETVTQAATMTAGSNAIGVTDLSKFPVGMPVTLSAAVNGFNAGNVYFVQSASAATGAGTVTLGDRESPAYNGAGGLVGGGPINATGSAAVNILTSGMPNLSIVAGGGSSTPGNAKGLMLHCKFGHLDLEGYSTTALHLENLGNCVVELIEQTGTSSVSLTGRSVVNSLAAMMREAVLDITSDCGTSQFCGVVKKYLNGRGFGATYDYTDDRGTFQWLGGNGGAPNSAGLFLAGGSLVQFNVAITKRVVTASGGTLSLDAGRAGVLPISFGGANALTLPTITNASVKTSWIGVPFEIVAVLGGFSLATDGTQLFSNSKTIIYVPQGGTLCVCAINIGGTYYWAIMGGKDIDVLRASPAYDPPSIAIGGHILRTVNVPGAVVGDRVEVSLSIDQQGLMLNAYVSAADTVAVDYINPPWNGAALDLSAHTSYVTVRRR